MVRELAPYDAGVRIPWWLLAAGFAVTELLVVRAHVRGSDHSLSLFELPLVIGLLLAEPIELVLGMVVGLGVVRAVRHARDLERLAFDLAQFAIAGALATITLHGLVPAPAEVGPALWGGTFAAVAVSSATAGLLAFCAAGLSGGSVRARPSAAVVGLDLLAALANTCVALAVATVVALDPHAGWLMLPPTLLLLVAYRAYVSERAKHQSLEFLYDVGRSLSRGGALEPALVELLRRARASFRVRTAELVLLTGDPDSGALRTSLDADDREEVMAPIPPGPAAALVAAVQGDHAVLVDRSECASDLRRYLAERDIAQALVAPVRGETRLAGVLLLGDRMGAAFADEDRRLFEALADHAGVSLEFDRLERAAMSDPLTGLANRTLFMRRVESSLVRASGSAAVLFLDLDDFKAVNDRIGHAAGDAVLVAAAKRIAAAVRPDDVAARLGGDEFAVLLEDVDDHHAQGVAHRILELLSVAIKVEHEAVRVRSSVGAAVAAAGTIGAAELLRRADAAMYRAKEAGKGQVCVWAPAVEESSGGAGSDEAHEEIVAHFQPIVSLDGGGLVAVEALARRPCSADVDLEMLRQACAAALAGAAPVVHVDLTTPPCSRTVMNVLDATGLDPARLVLELSEPVLAAASPSELARLRAISVRIALDGFGSSDGALRLLQDRTLDIAKIAPPFVHAAPRTDHDRAVLSLLLQLASSFGLDVVADGIEREDQREVLLALGCELGQGGLLGDPLPLQDALELR